MSKREAQRIVIYRLGSLGDTVVALPCFHKVSQVWPDAQRIVLTNVPVSANAAPLEAILRDGGLIHETIAYPVGTRSVIELWRLASRLRRLHAQTLVYLTSSRGLKNAFRDWMFFKLCGFKNIIGVPLTADLQRCRRHGPDSAGDNPDDFEDDFQVEERECERLARCLSTLGPINLDDPRMWNLRLTDRERQVGNDVVAPLGRKPYFAINMGGKAKEKDWGLPNWLSLLGRLSAQFSSAGLLIVGAAEDSERARQASEVWMGPVVNACGRLSPRESAAAMSRAAAFIGHDSGPLHLAAATGVRCVGLLGNFNRPRRWHPWGAQHRIIHRMSGLQDISVAEVIEATQDVVKMNSDWHESARPVPESSPQSIQPQRNRRAAAAFQSIDLRYGERT
jgi:heptosyltransferase III